MKPLGDVKRTENKFVADIKRDLNIQTALIIILAIIALILCFKSMKLAIDYEDLRQEKQALEEYIEIENMKFKEGTNEK